MSKRPFLFEYSEDEECLVLHLRSKLPIDAERKLIRIKNNYTNIIVEGIEGFMKATPYILKFKIARLHQNKEDLSTISSEVVNILGLTVPADWMEEAFKLDYIESQTEEVAIMLQEETEVPLSLCYEALEANDYNYEASLTWINSLF